MSDIVGEGYGSSHNWKFDLKDVFKYEGKETAGIRYRCRRCDEIFVHPYIMIPGVFEAMESRGVSERCIVGHNDHRETLQFLP